MNLTLTSVVFEYGFVPSNIDGAENLTLTSVVFEYVWWHDIINKCRHLTLTSVVFEFLLPRILIYLLQI